MKAKITAYCAALLALLVLPFGVLAAWDKLLLGRDFPQAVPADTLSDAGRSNVTACTLYNCAHIFGAPAGGDYLTDSWTTTEADSADLAQLTSFLTDLHKAGLLNAAQLRLCLNAANAGPDAAHSLTAPCGLRGYSVQLLRDEAYTYDTLQFYYLENGSPLSLRFYAADVQAFGSCTPDDAFVQTLLQVLGLDSFADWQPAAWRGRTPAVGAAAYSAEAQLYLSVTELDGISFSLTSLTPQDFAALYQEQEVLP